MKTGSLREPLGRVSQAAASKKLAAAWRGFPNAALKKSAAPGVPRPSKPTGLLARGTPRPVPIKPPERPALVRSPLLHELVVQRQLLHVVGHLLQKEQAVIHRVARLGEPGRVARVVVDQL